MLAILAILAIPDGASTCAGDGRVGDSWGIGSSGIGPKLGDPWGPQIHYCTVYWVYCCHLLSGWWSYSSRIPAWNGQSHWNMLESWDQLEPPSAYFVEVCRPPNISEPLPGLRACARVQANRAEEISAGADWEIKRSLKQNPIWSSRFFTHFYDEECPEAFK